MNVIRHSDASNAFVRFSFDDQQIELEIRDDGKGFSVPKRWIELVREGHLGLAGAAERARTFPFWLARMGSVAIGGRLHVESSPGDGTILRVVVPRQSDYRASNRQEIPGKFPEF